VNEQQRLTDAVFQKWATWCEDYAAFLDDDTRTDAQVAFDFAGHAVAIIPRLLTEVRALREEREKWRATALDRAKSFCTWCGTMFPKGKDGVLLFQAHVAECNKHPLHPLTQRAEVAEAEATRLREIVTQYRGYVADLQRHSKAAMMETPPRFIDAGICAIIGHMRLLGKTDEGTVTR
jgi:hypothetical protein